jgi:hypothetical protein
VKQISITASLLGIWSLMAPTQSLGHGAQASAAANSPTERPAAMTTLSSLSYEVKFRYSVLRGLEAETGITRRDPSDIIRFRDKYYVWYTKTDKAYSGYNASICFANSADGLEWQEQGEALPRGPQGAWDSYSVFTPNILCAHGKFYLFYTGVRATLGNPHGEFENNHTSDITAIGVAVAETPTGPFTRVTANPVLEVSANPADFDSYRVDDACLLVRKGLYWLYYKGRSRIHGAQGPRHTRMGVACATKPSGPYQKYAGNPLVQGGHEVMVWPFKEGVMTLLSAHGAAGRTLQYSQDGYAFEIVGRFGGNYPKAPGSFRSDEFLDILQHRTGIAWGISMHYGNQKTWPHLLRYEIELAPSKRSELE